MYDLNNLVLQGRIVRNAEFTTTDTGLPVRGQQMTVEGFLKQDKWEKDGVKHSEIKIGVIRIYLTGYPPAQTQEGMSSNPVPVQGNVAVSAAELSTEICPPDGLGFEEAVPF